MTTPSGWYQDPNGEIRWWDGNRWTEQVQRPPLPRAQRANDQKAAGALRRMAVNREEAKRVAAQEYEDFMSVVGSLVTTGVYGEHTIQLYSGGFVRIEGPSNPKGSGESRQPKKPSQLGILGKVLTSEGDDPNWPPYEKLTNITFTKAVQPGQGQESDYLGDAATRAIGALFKGGKAIAQASTPGLIMAGGEQVLKAVTGKSVLTITTDYKIHSLSNVDNHRLVKRDHETVGEMLASIGRTILIEQGTLAAEPPANSGPSGAGAGSKGSGGTSAEPSLADRLRGLAALHAEGVLDDAEFAKAKAKLLENL